MLQYQLDSNKTILLRKESSKMQKCIKIYLLIFFLTFLKTKTRFEFAACYHNSIIKVSKALRKYIKIYVMRKINYLFAKIRFV